MGGRGEGALPDMRKAIRTIVGGTQEYHSLTLGLPRGPADLDEALDWPSFKGKLLFCSPGGSTRYARLRRMVENKVCLSTDFTCRDGVGQSFRMTEAMMARTGLEKDWLYHLRGSEPQDDLRGLMVSECCYKTIEETFLNEHHTKRIEAMTPKSSASKKVKAEMYAMIQKYLDKNGPSIFHEDYRSLNCTKHEGNG